MDTDRGVILNSGGMDTFLMAQLTNNAPKLHVFVDVMQKYYSKELMAAQRSAHECGAELVVVSKGNIAKYEHHSGIIPFRNAELILAAAQYADNIWVGVLAGEINSDKSPEFFRAMEAVMNISHRQQYWTPGRVLRIHTPVATFTKSQLVAAYVASGKRLAPLLATVSCYSATRKHCGRCSSCFKRWVALVNNGIAVEGQFEAAPQDWLTKQEWAVKMRDYDYVRATEVGQALYRAHGWLFELTSKPV
jgi:7-cyano-7-deazaguanine synthase